MKRTLSKVGSHLSILLISLIFLLVIFIINSHAFPSKVKNYTSDFAFGPGEKLTFKLKWYFIPAGEAVLEVLPIENFRGIKAYHFVLHVKTNEFFDSIYKIRDRIDSYTDIGMTRSILYKKRITGGGKHKRDIVVDFNWNINQAQYSNFGRKRKPVSILPGSFDPLSIFFYSRICKFEEGVVFQRPVTDGKKCVIGSGKVIKREIIKLQDKRYDTYLLEPEIKDLSGVFRKSKDATIKIWVTADKRKIPIRIKSKVVVGSFTGELAAAEGLVK
jgi:hypothetical protein